MITTELTPADLSVVVPTKDEASNIVTFLDSLPDDVHLIVVDSSTDGTPEIIEQHRRLNTTVVRAKANIPVARQIGSETARTPWLLFTDADVVFSSDYFRRLFASPLPGGCGGVVGTKASQEGFDRYHRWFARGQAVLMALGVPAATGSNMLISRDVLHAVGGFDDQLCVNEDTEIMFRVAKAGWTVDFRPDLVVRAFDHRRLEAGIIRKILHGAVRNTALYLGWFDHRVRRSDWGYWTNSAARAR